MNFFLFDSISIFSQNRLLSKKSLEDKSDNTQSKKLFYIVQEKSSLKKRLEMSFIINYSAFSSTVFSESSLPVSP